MLQLQLIVWDGGTPRREDTCVLIITVLRNMNAPVFNPVNYYRDIREDQTLGLSITQVFCSDADSPKVRRQ
jgi:hypothetical protein